MQTKFLLAPVILLALVCAPIAFADEIVVVDADNVWNLTLDDATDVDRLVGEPDVMVVKYADMFSYKSLENATEIERLVGEPGVMVVDTPTSSPTSRLRTPPKWIGSPVNPAL